MKAFCTLFLLLITTGLFAQRPQPTPADSLRDAGDIKGAIEWYAQEFQKNPDNRNNSYNYACALSIDRQIDTAFQILKIAIAKDTSVQALNDPDFYNLIEDERWTEIEDHLVKHVEAKYGKYENLPLSKELWKMKIKDQAFYYHLEVADKVAGRNSPVVSAIWETKRLINDQNLKRIIEIIDTQGWPKKSIIKGSAASTVFLIIQHSEPEVQRKYLPIMKAAADEGEASWRSLALLIDRVNLGEDKPQIYGSQIGRKDDGTFYVLDLEEPEYVNQRRKKVGLGPIQDYVKLWDIEWTVEQKEK